MVYGLGLRVWGLGFRAWGEGFRLQGVEFRVEEENTDVSLHQLRYRRLSLSRALSFSLSVSLSSQPEIKRQVGEG
jgi:hypothetical protein